MTCIQNSGVRLRDLFSLFLLSLLLTGCEQPPDPKEPVFTSITPYNHTEDYIHQLYVDGAWGGNQFAYSGGGSVCCIGVPREWRPGLTATVRWTTSSSIPGTHSGETWHEQVVQIEPYQGVGTAYVHFLPWNRVRLIISRIGPGFPGNPGPGYPEKPADWPY